MQDNLQSEVIEITIEITGADLSREIRYHADEYDQENLVFLTKLIQKLVWDRVVLEKVQNLQDTLAGFRRFD